MKSIVVKDWKKLKQILEDERNYRYYEKFIFHKPVLNAVVDSYPHDGGALVEETGERRWIYVRVEYDMGDKIGRYDIALWKLRDLIPVLVEAGAIEISFG